MSGNFSKRSPVHASDAFYSASSQGKFNETANHIKYDPQAVGVIDQALREMGQHHLISMNGSLTDAMVSLVFYAGDGNLIKVMPHSYRGDDYVLQLPPISEKLVETDMRAYMVRTYPFIHSRPTTQSDVELMKRTAGALGMEFNPGDDTPRNLMTLPDAEGTLVSVDADAFRTARDGLNYGPELYRQWQDYLAELFPAYKKGKITEQTAQTDFTFRMNYNAQSHLLRFDPLSANPFVYDLNDSKPPEKRHWWDIFTGPGHG